MENFTADSATASRPCASPMDGVAAATAAIPQAQAKAASARATIRTYRHGPGECHLVTLHGDAGKNYRILIDCGVALVTRDASAVMQKVMSNIVEESDGQVDLLVATHEHWDHISGFVQAAAEFAQLKVGEVWMPWTEDPNDPAAQDLHLERAQALEKLRLAGARMQLRGTEAESNAINSLLEFYGAAGRASTQDALEAVRAKTPAPVYCSPGGAPRELPEVGARIYVLGPPRSEASLKKMSPSKRDSETYDITQEDFLLNVAPSLDGTEAGNPFSTLYSIPEPVAHAMPFFQQHYWDDARWRRIDTAWMADSTQYALALDSLTNNTSLVLAIELDGGDVLLFAAGAEVGNSMSWGDLAWSVDGRQVDGRDLLGRTVFYKVGHHASVHATLKKEGLELMPKLLVAVIPVDHAMALSMRGGEIPPESLQLALADATRDRGYVLRTDQDPPAAALARGVSATAGYFDVQL